MTCPVGENAREARLAPAGAATSRDAGRIDLAGSARHARVEKALAPSPQPTGETTTEAWPDRRSVQVLQLEGGQSLRRADEVIEEVPVALVYNGVSHAVMLVTPTDLEDFALGFSLGEGIVGAAGELEGCECVPVPQGIECRMSLGYTRVTALKERRRTLAGRTGCGLCGVESLAALERPTVPVARTCAPRAGAIARALAELPRHQPLFRRTGGGHAAAWVGADGQVRLVREDVGRHNALDKLIGALARVALHPRGRLRHLHQPRQLRDGPEGDDRRHRPPGRGLRPDGVGHPAGPGRPHHPGRLRPRRADAGLYPSGRDLRSS